jgi:hypothetical protein
MAEEIARRWREAAIQLDIEQSDLASDSASSGKLSVVPHPPSSQSDTNATSENVHGRGACQHPHQAAEGVPGPLQ